MNVGSAPIEGPWVVVSTPARESEAAEFADRVAYTTPPWFHQLPPGKEEPFTVDLRRIGGLSFPVPLSITNGRSDGEAGYRVYSGSQRLLAPSQ